jgi:predicted sulfurtransferase
VAVATELDSRPSRYIKWMRILLLAVAVAAQLAPSDGAPRISQAEFKKLRATKKVVIVDTRTRDAYDRGHIPGAVLLPVEGRQTWPDEYNATAEGLKSAKKPIVTYCA